MCVCFADNWWVCVCAPWDGLQGGADPGRHAGRLFHCCWGNWVVSNRSERCDQFVLWESLQCIRFTSATLHYTPHFHTDQQPQFQAIVDFVSKYSWLWFMGLVCHSVVIKVIRHLNAMNAINSHYTCAILTLSSQYLHYTQSLLALHSFTWDRRRLLESERASHGPDFCLFCCSHCKWAYSEQLRREEGTQSLLLNEDLLCFLISSLPVFFQAGAGWGSMPHTEQEGPAIRKRILSLQPAKKLQRRPLAAQSNRWTC